MLHRQLSVTAVFLALRSKHWEDVEDLEAHLTLAWRSRSGALIRSCCHGARALETELTVTATSVLIWVEMWCMRISLEDDGLEKQS